MSSDVDKPRLKWQVKFKFKEEHHNLLIDLKNTPLFNNKYPVFKMLLAHEILDSTASQFFHIKRAEHSTEILDPTGKEVPMDSCIFILGISKELGILKLLFFPQHEERFVLVGLDEVWVKVLEKIDEPKRMTVLTNVIAALVMDQDSWSQVYIVY